MKMNKMNLLVKWALGVCLLLAGVQSAFALNGQVCAEGTVYLQAPASWTEAYAAGGGKFVPFKKQADGWWTVSSSLIGQGQDTTFFIASADNDYCQKPGVTNIEYDKAGCTQNAGIPCSKTGDLYIFPNPTDPEKPVISENPPDAKYFFVMIPPDYEEWLSAVPMISTDGGQTGKPMKAVDGMCGWYSYVFFNEEITDNVVLFRDDDTERDDMIGVNGNWETAATAQPIALNMIFNMVDSLFFVPDEEQKTNDDGYYYSAAEVDGIEGSCSYTMAAIIYDSDASLHPAFSCYGGPGDPKPHDPNPTFDACQEVNQTNAASGADKTTALRAIYECIGVTPGIVESTLDETVPQSQRKPKLSSAGKKCFIDDKYFNMLFNYTQGVNEKSCFDMPFHRSNDGKWEFDSDYYTSPGLSVQGGFYPVEATTDATILEADPTQTPVAKARTKRTAQGPVFYGPLLRADDPNEGIPVIDVLCNGPGWNGGMDCEGIFADGDGTTAALVSHLKLGENACVFGWSCPNDAPKGWAFFSDGTESAPPANQQGTPRWTSKENASGKGGRNQQFCFESHAKFTHKPGLKFNFRGDDDIWVFIDNQLAVDLGGTHLAAPGYVNLDKFKGKSGELVAGNQYDLDIFFCDRRTTMSNVRIKTNMYIVQKTAIDVKGAKNKQNPAETSYNICYTKSGDGSCAAAMTGDDKEETYCGDQIKNAGLNISYTLVNGNLASSEPVPGFENVTTPGVYKCGVDLTSITAPKVDKDKMCLGGGRYTLFVNIDGKSKKVATFRMSGEVDVIYANGVAKDTNGVDIPGGKYNLQTTAMAGEYIPVYVSSVAPGEGNTKGVEIFPQDAAGVEYTLSYDKVLELYYDSTLADGSTARVKLASGQKRVIGESGVDTLYATIDMDNMTNSIQSFKVGVTGRENTVSISFYLPQITFIEKIPEEGASAKSVKGQTPNSDGSYDEYWVGSVYDLYLAVLKPNEDGSYSACLTECDGLKIHMGSQTSPKIQFIDSVYTFENGYATISIRSLTKYRWDTDPSIYSPATIVAEYNDFVQAVYNPIYFRDPPVPYPVLADVFDVKGKTPSLEHKIPDPYFSMSQEYLDGIGDSIAIYYDRPIHKDSLPTKLCVMWDSASAENHNPYKDGYSTIPKDTAITCNQLIEVSSSNIDCSSPVEYNGTAGYCTNLITIGGLTLSEAVKTAGVGKVHSYAIFEDKGKKVKQGFAGALTDRMAPVPLRAEVRTIKNGDDLTDYDSLVIIMSEPVKLVTTSNRKDALDFYLNSAIDLPESNRFVSALGNTSAKVTAQNEPALGSAKGEGRIKYMYLRGSVSPHVGDYVRLGGDLSNIFWSDTTDLTNLGGDTLRAVSDAAYYWNSPTSYNETKRLPSMWVPVTGDAEIAVIENKFASTANGPSGDKVPAVTVNAYRTTMTKNEVMAAEGGKPGHFVKADMYALFNGLDEEERKKIEPGDIFFYYEVQYYTNLGGFVASKSEKIYCDDSKNSEKYFNGGLCTDAGNDRNFFIGWNMRSDKGRMVGTGAYIVKLNSYVKLGSAGKEAKQESTSVWGIKRSPKPVTDYLKASSN
ncbi:fibro-slime domain-containing protein [Fibrobacter sp. UWB1]|uniref:fibro-slime domain-containing protein n=1 Tax=Fibrobacter sp. UWB1 TaxID=1964355 RepID=UPI001483B1EB|nr:fibro-slime domain-containing protein [Fibrobacter sp. UWB1]